MIRVGAIAALVVAMAAPTAADALTITGRRILSDVERCNEHKKRLRSAVFVAEVDIQVVSTWKGGEPDEFPGGEVALKPLETLAGGARTTLFYYTGSFYAPAVSDTSYISHGRSVAFIFRDDPHLTSDNLYLIPRDQFEADAEICRTLGV